ncbi:GNAT family N-acetyltransferase [Geofilum rubicundum]|uniref:Histone acetyltransferase n=1 Tax=Geofilum rubicundum JCM 15548 TaxID=1236989 RepID=A0A0E9LZN3_9BACT|nr:GNAT family N-acetyltransferase [Geofilum rubicundum]GAO31017.1 histone acetyltransferase [Geofilum rubicundum JCM 15548]
MKIREFKLEDLNILRVWLEQNYIQEFWGDPQVWIREISENICIEWVKYFMVECDKPIGFLQYYETDKAPQGEWSDEPIGTVGIDYLIGDSEYLGKGYGTAIILLLVDFIKSSNQYDYVVADPIKGNVSSIKALEKNGFKQNTNGLFGLDLTNTGIKIYRASKQDVSMITQLFRDTIQNVNSKDYPEDEIEDWSSWWTDTDKWQERIEEQYFIKAMIGDKIVGFSSLASDGYLDFMFTHKDYQRHGVAGNLLRKIERKAKEQGNDLIYSDVSITAKGFFERHGFIVKKRQFKKSRNKELINFRMTKTIK